MDLNAFKKKMAEDSSFRAKFAGCKTPEDLIAAAAKEGYKFTVADISAAAKLSPEELQKAAGGWGDLPETAWHVVDPSFITIPH